MLDILRGVGLDPTQFLILLALSAIVLILAYRPFVIGLLDPLNVFIIAMCADVVLMLGLDWELSSKVEFLFFIFFFWSGFAFAGRVPAQHPVINFHSESLLELETILLITGVTIAIANVYLGITAGFPLFSSDPSVSKVTTFTGGLGAIRRLDGGPFYFLAGGCTLLIAVGHKRALAMLILLVNSAFVALSGSKGALLPILFMQAFVISHKGFGENNKYVKKIKKLTLPSFAAALSVAIAVVVRDNGGLSQGIVFLAKRMLFFGDVILFYYPRRGAIPELRGVGLLNYLQYLIDPTLGLLRLKDYAVPLGTIIGGNLDNGFGPNVQYFVRADIFFGPILGCVYCLIIGLLCGYFRKLFFTVCTRNIVVFTLVLALATSSLSLAVESQLFVGQMLDMLLFICPLCVVARLARISATAPRQFGENSGIIP